MPFPTFSFAVFFAGVLVVAWLLHGFPRPWKLFLLASSYTFYGSWDWRFCSLIALSTIGNQGFAELVHRTADEASSATFTRLAVAFNLALLGVFKYLGFFTESIADALSGVGLGMSPPVLDILLPVGISFFTFQALSYVIDVHRGHIEPSPPLDFAVYLAFFPQLVAGPIVRASEFLPQLARRPDPRRIDLARAARLIGAGLFKKVVISSYLAEALVDDAFAQPDRYSSLELLAAAYGYAIQIYADFSGYTDIAIGVALMLGFSFPDNFDRPYSATSIQDFWRRWHITLSSWLRDYLYVPLGGNRRGAAIRDRNLFLTMLLGGLWHGAAWTFVAWGALHGLGLLVERRVRAVRSSPAEGGLIGRVVTFHFVCAGWVFFRSESFELAGTFLSRIVTAAGSVDAVTPLFVAVVLGSLLVQWAPPPTLAPVRSVVADVPVSALAAGFGAWLVVVDLLGPEGVAPFIYFQF